MNEPQQTRLGENERDFSVLYDLVRARLDELKHRRQPLPNNLVRMEQQLVTEAKPAMQRRAA